MPYIPASRRKRRYDLPSSTPDSSRLSSSCASRQLHGRRGLNVRGRDRRIQPHTAERHLRPPHTHPHAHQARGLLDLKILLLHRISPCSNAEGRVPRSRVRMGEQARQTSSKGRLRRSSHRSCTVTNAKHPPLHRKGFRAKIAAQAGAASTWRFRRGCRQHGHSPPPQSSLLTHNIPPLGI